MGKLKLKKVNLDPRVLLSREVTEQSLNQVFLTLKPKFAGIGFFNLSLLQQWYMNNVNIMGKKTDEQK